MKQPVIISIILASAVALSVSAEDLTLSQCRTMALSHNTSAEMQQEAIAAAEMLKKASVAAMMPKASANAGYVWNSSDLHLLGNQTTGEWGTVGVGADGSAYLEWANAEALNHLTGAPVVGGEINQLQAQTGQAMADAYKQLYDRLTVDMTHIVVAQVGITQPIYMGGRLHEMHKLASSAEKMAELTAESLRSDIVVKTDEAYWRVVNVEQKQQLAHKYYDLLKKLEGDVRELQAEGLATQSDLLNVTAKLGEAEVKRLQADNGLILSKMALCQVIGLPLDADILPKRILPIRICSAEKCRSTTVMRCSSFRKRRKWPTATSVWPQPGCSPTSWPKPTTSTPTPTRKTASAAISATAARGTWA